MPADVNPVAIIFICVLAFAFIVGVSATVYFAWFAPCIENRKLRKQMRKRNRPTAPTTSCPGTPDGALKTPQEPLDSLDLEKCPSIFSKEAEGMEETLSPPPPVFTFSRDRFSSSSRDGVWWVV